MNNNDLTIRKLRELPIFDVCRKLDIALYGMGQLTRRTRCWYHDDKHPSMHVNKKKNIYKCFVCGKGGDVIRLVQDYQNLSFAEACDWLVREFQVVVTQNEPPAVKSAQSVPETKPLVPLDAALVQQSQGVNSEFCQALVAQGYMTQQQMQAAAARYRLGMTKDRAVIFWEIDSRQQVRTGKMMHYLADCHRDKQHTPTWVHSVLQGRQPVGFNLQHCLFGLHLTSDISHQTSPVCVVESEKTAVICSVHFPDAVWLSCGGLQMLKPELLAPLVNYKVILFPDTDEQGEAYRTWLNIAQEAQRCYPFKHPLRVSALLETEATADQKRRKIDIADFLFETPNPPSQ